MILLLILMMAGEAPTWKIDLSEHEVYRKVMLVVGDQGTVALMDWSSSQLLMFDGTGKFLRRLGKKGQGPGEIGRLGGMGWRAETNRFWIYDGGNSKILYFDSGGKLVSEVKMSVNLRNPRTMSGQRLAFTENGLGMGDEIPAVKILSLTSGKIRPLWSHGKKSLANRRLLM